MSLYSWRSRQPSLPGVPPGSPIAARQRWVLSAAARPRAYRQVGVEQLTDRILHPCAHRGCDGFVPRCHSASSTLLGLGTHGGLVAGSGVTAGRIYIHQIPRMGPVYPGSLRLSSRTARLQGGDLSSEEISWALRWSIFTSAIRMRGRPIQTQGATGGTNEKKA